LRNDETARLKERFDTKAEATAGSALEQALASAGGSVKNS